MSNLPQTMRDINVFVDGIGHLGTSEEFELPKINQKKFSQEFGGFEREILSGSFEKMEANVTLNEYSAAVYAAMAVGNVTGLGVNITVKGAIYQDGKSLQAIATIQGNIDIDDGSWKANEQVKRKLKIAVNLYAMEIDGKQACLFDVNNMIAMIDGVDFLATLRSQIQ
ncbi:MAG TPA: phage major tail tube protein [Aliarcobacter sp.]|nr:phage major tail tube protein [Aliarcobacter sp.]